MISARYSVPHMSNEAHIKRRGRPAGSTSFTTIKMETLRSLLGSTATIVVSKKWLANIDLVAGDRREDIEDIQKALVEPAKIEFTLTNA